MYDLARMTAHLPLFDPAFLRTRWHAEYVAFRGSPAEAELMERLRRWSERQFQNERVAEAAFLDTFFKDTWGYLAAGQGPRDEGFTCHPQYPVQNAGAGGGVGAADVALGCFGLEGRTPVPQVLGEFKDVRSGLDAPQRRKDSMRSPVEQCADYLREASRAFRWDVLEPAWGFVSDMNEFRLYARATMPMQYERFVLARRPGRHEPLVLLDDGEDAALARFLFRRMFARESLLATDGRGSELARLLKDQGVHERALEADFYREYHAYRERVFRTLVEMNPSHASRRGKLVRLTQRLLDRCLFVMFCEDMGPRLSFPHHLLRDLLIRESLDPAYDPDATDIWAKLKRLFRAMRDGTPFGTQRINAFNGGLFAEDPELDELVVPNRLFCAPGQGDLHSWGIDTETLLYHSAFYNFGVEGGGRKTISLYALGRIFEQSITDLELMEARAEDRPSLTELSKRKRDGVYYTPETVTAALVEHTLGACFADLKREHGLSEGPDFGPDEIDVYRQSLHRKDAARFAPRVRAYLTKLEAYRRDVSDLKVVDPACGSGAFLIQAMNALVRERDWIQRELDRITATLNIEDQATLVREVLSKNLYGVDINAESVEITRLALWLNTALPDRPLTTLDHNIRSGNSLAGPDFYAWRQVSLFSPEQQDRINAFDWRAAFPEVFAREGDKAGFDVVIGNPPYVKLQNFRQVEPDLAEYLVQARSPEGGPLYASTQTGNFDMYLPFIERGVGLLNARGRMGFIAPSVWLKNEYGAGLRGLIGASRRLGEWVDFGDYQVFDEAVTYTALQFYRGRAVDHVACVFAPDGELGAIDWDAPHARVPYAELRPDAEHWVLAPDTERALLAKLESQCQRLDDVASGIVVGLQTSADDIYHLTKLGPGRYLSFAASRRGVEVELEDTIMRPLVSGTDAKRYLVPSPTTHLLFPYDDSGARVALFSPAVMASRFTKAWSYLRDHEKKLRARERGKFDDDDAWYRFGRSQNLDKQRLPKLMVPRLTLSLALAADPEGRVALDNVDVNGVLAEDVTTLWFLLGMLNGAVANFAWLRGSKPFQHGYRAANKQFIAPLPIPKVTDVQRADVAARAQELQRMHTARRDATEQLARRLASARAEKRGLDWLWEDIGTVAAWKSKAPLDLTGRALTAWAKEQIAARRGDRLAELGAKLREGARLEATYADGELTFLVDGVEAARTYVDPELGPFYLAQWRRVARTTTVTTKTKPEQMATALVQVAEAGNAALRTQVIDLDAKLARFDVEIDQRERALDLLLFDLYGLTVDERAFVEADRAARTWRGPGSAAIGSTKAEEVERDSQLAAELEARLRELVEGGRTVEARTLARGTQ